MTSIGRAFLRNLVLTLLVLGAGVCSASAYTAVTPELVTKTEVVRKQMEQRVSDAERRAAAESLKALRQQIHEYKLMQADPTIRVKGQTQVNPLGILGIDFKAIPTAPFDAAGNPNVPDYNTTANWAYSPPLAKFVDRLPTLDCSLAGKNELGQCLPVAVPDTVTYPGSDYYEISLEEWHEVMHSDMPLGTPTRGYVQTNNGTDQTAVAGGCTAGATPSDNSCNTIAPAGQHFMGPLVVARRNRPVRVKFTNKLPAGTGGDLFLPVDQSVMGAGEGPLNRDGSPCNNTDYENNTCDYFPQTRATVHLHGGRTPWISDGTPHQWITPANEVSVSDRTTPTPYPRGVSVSMVPDMPDPGPGSMTFYYTNQQSARLLFYHDHAFGITRLNVLAGMAAGYLITDRYEQDLIDREIIPGKNPTDQIPLVIQDRTFVDATLTPNPLDNNVMTPTVRLTDPLWNWGTGPMSADGKTREPQTGDLWYSHVYMPAQNPTSPGGVNPFGRWFYGPWFYPPTVITHPPIANPYYDPDCSSSNPWVLADCQTPGQPPEIPATPHPSMGMEAFFDTWIVNGTAFPRLEVEPKAYRFRILNAANDRGSNLMIMKADPTQLSDITPGSTRTPPGMVSNATNNYTVSAKYSPQTEVKLVPATTTPGWPADWPTDGREGGVPDPGDCTTGRCSNFGPPWIQIGNDAGFLPRPVVIDPQPVTYRVDPTAFWVGNVYKTSLALMPAERADVVVDFSAYAGQTLIVYNDAPTAWPALFFVYDYYTGAPDNRDSGGYGAGGWFNTVTGAWEGGHGPFAGYGPNTRTVMQIVVGNTVTNPATHPFNLADLQKEYTTAADPTAIDPYDPAHAALLNAGGLPLFERSMEPIVVTQPDYQGAYKGKTFTSTWPWAGARTSILDRTLKFITLNNEKVEIPLQPKGLHDEMGASFDPEYGRMSGNLAIEIQPPTTNNANLNLYGFNDVPTEIVQNSPPGVMITSLGAAADGTQIWNISHNGVDTHPIHFHIFDVQVINRIGWDGLVEYPLPNEIGWKDTVRISPLEDTIVAVRPTAPALPFGIPNSMRPLSPAIPIGSTMGLSNTDPATGQAYVAPSPYAGGVVNQLHDFGWEYVWHCHILSHEEMDMMRPIILLVQTNLVGNTNFSLTTPYDTVPGTPEVDLSWTDPTPVDYVTHAYFGDDTNEIGFNIWRSDGGTGVYQKIGSVPANHTAYKDVSPVGTSDIYVIEAYNQSGSTYSNSPGAVTLNVSPGAPYTYTAPASINLSVTVAAPLAQSVTKVDYYNGTNLLGTATTAPYTLSLTGVQAGTYEVFAVVTAEVPDPPTSTVNKAVLTTTSSTTTLTVTGGLAVNFTANAGAPIGLCDPISLVASITGAGTAPYSFVWAVDGVAQAPSTVGTLSLPAMTMGTHSITLTLTDAIGLTSSATNLIDVINHAPTASSGGPYTLGFGSNLVLNGSGTDVDTCSPGLTYAWDIDNDGVYDYFANRTIKYSVLQPWLSSTPAGAGPYTMSFKVTDANGASTVSSTTLTLAAPVFTNTTTALVTGAVNFAYSLQLTAVGGTAPYNWSAFGLPAGLSISPSGLISGTPTAVNVKAGSTFATFPVSIITVDSAAAPASLGTVMYLRINK
ncbi:Ig-like domain-containing protein [Geopsychrobacter electrodiphilus]|uniref:Ig-like domain-containing protein n=1 Tax=Geopsychrobacter electrodiphilus TaxID=225196 RepID=UPI0003613489|nr:Ig-like domain-containing protein [Geopsychrobacter electrodiphilus]